MKTKNIVLMITFCSLSLLSYELYAQDRDVRSNREVIALDSMETASQKEIEEQETKDENTIADFRNDKRRTKAIAKEAQRVENEASAAARESRYALRAEKRAQKARKDADRQAKKASEARVKSDKN